MMTFTDSSLMKCPFCGGDAEIVLEDFENGYVHCKACGAKRVIDKAKMILACRTGFINAAHDTWDERPIVESDIKFNHKAL